MTSSFYRWYDRYQQGGPEALADLSSKPDRIWNRIPDKIREQIIEMALDLPELSPRELAVRFTDTKQYFVSESSVYRLLKSQDLITSPAYIVIKAANEFKDKTTAPNQLWQTDFTYLKITGWGWYYLSTILDDFSRYIVAWKLCPTMKAQDVCDTLDLALRKTGLDQISVQHLPRLLSDNEASYISSDLAEWLDKRKIQHIRGPPFGSRSAPPWLALKSDIKSSNCYISKLSLEIKPMRLIVLLAVMPVMLSPSYSYAQSHRGIPTYTPFFKSLPPLPKGNGIYNYSVATDYYYGTQNPVGQPSLAYDLGNPPSGPLNPNSASNIVYVFPDFVSLNGLASYGGSVASLPSSPADFSQTQCAYDPNKNKGLNGSNIIEYVALPELNLAAVGQTLSPTLTTAVGNYCYNGAAVTQYYKNINGGQLKVVPNASYADISFPTMIATGSKSNIKAIADALANVINQDPSTLGLAIDNEPSINGINKNTSTGKLDPTSVQNEQNFFQELAAQLATKNKYLFLFDAPDTARILFGYGLTNVIVMSYLYDLGNTDPSTPPAYNPTPLGTGNNQDTSNYTYSGMVYKAAASALSDTPNNVYKGQSQQVTLVLPASATSSLWDYYTVYNVAPGSTSSSVTPVLPAATAASVIANSPNNCTNNPIPNPSTNPPASQTLMLNLLFPSSVNIVTFFNNTNCFKYTNPLSLTNQSMEQYFATSLDAVKKANANTNSHYLGVTLYAWKIAADNDLQAGKSSVLSAYGPDANGYITKTTPNISLQGPPNIKSGVWDLLNKWQGSITK